MKKYKKRKFKKTPQKKKRNDTIVRRIAISNEKNDFKKTTRDKKKYSSINMEISNSIGVDSENLKATGLDKLSNDKITAYDTKLRASTITP